MSEAIEILDQSDGSAIMTMDVGPRQVKSFIKSGLDYVIEQMRVNDGLVHLSVNEFSKSPIEIYLSPEEANALFHFGVIGALRSGLDEQNKEETKDRR